MSDTVQATRRTRRAAEDPAGHRLLGAVSTVPDRAPMLLLWVSVVVSATVLVGQFRPVVVLPACAVVVVATWRLVPHRVRSPVPSGWGALTALAFTAVWLVLNLPYAARFLIVSRDPGFLTLEGLWLTSHADPELPMGSAEAVADQLAGFTSETGAYYPMNGDLHAQGAKLLPGLLALGGWAAGDSGVLVGNLVVGAVALLAVYGLARRLVGPWWALVPLVALALSVPMLVFSRAAYTEPHNVALVFGALTMSWSAFETRSWWRHLVSGAMVGATALSRIDGSASVIGYIAGLALVAAATVLPRHRRRAQVGFLTAVAAALLLVGLGYADLRLHSPGYLADLGDQFALLAGALAGTVAVALMISLPRAWDPLRRLVLRRRRPLAVAAVVLVLLVAAALSTRFLWLPGYNIPLSNGASALVEGLQAREGMAIEPTRSYDDWSVRWLSWYYGWPMVVLAFAGLALLAHRAIVRRDPRLLLVLAVIAAPSALYLWRVSISPDQVWAMRRLLPVTIPGFLVMGTVVLHALWRTRRAWARTGAAVLAAVVALFPLTTWTELIAVPEQDGRLGEIRAVCEALPSDKVLYIQPGGPPYLATLRSVCDVEVVQVERMPTQDELAKLSAAWGGDVSFVAFRDDLTWGGDAAPAPLRSGEVTTWSYALSYIPSEPVVYESEVWVGTIAPDGALVPVAPGS